MNLLQRTHGDWSNSTFRSHYKPDGSPNPLAPWHHLVDEEKGEVWELGAALELGEVESVAQELADCQLLLCSIANLCGIDLEAAAWAKYRLNATRQWGEPDENGVVEHIKVRAHDERPMPSCDCGAPAVCRVTGRLTPYGDKLITNLSCQECLDTIWRREVEAGIATMERLEDAPCLDTLLPSQ